MAAELTEQFCLQGVEVALEDAEVIKASGFALIDAQAGPITVDLAALERANSVTVALLVAWYRRATVQQKAITFVNLPEGLRDIIEFSGLSRVLMAKQ